MVVTRFKGVVESTVNPETIGSTLVVVDVSNDFIILGNTPNCKAPAGLILEFSPGAEKFNDGIGTKSADMCEKVEFDGLPVGRTLPIIIGMAIKLPGNCTVVITLLLVVEVTFVIVEVDMVVEFATLVVSEFPNSPPGPIKNEIGLMPGGPRKNDAGSPSGSGVVDVVVVFLFFFLHLTVDDFNFESWEFGNEF